MKYFPNYLNSFNYKVHFNLLPVKSKFMDFYLDNDSRCPFCDLNFETLFHIMGKCNILNVLWNFLDEVMIILNIQYKFSSSRKLLHDFEIMSIKCKSDFLLISYLTTLVNYHLWKTRNAYVHEKDVFSVEKLVNKLIKSIGARVRMEKAPVFLESRKIPRIEEMFSSLLSLLSNMGAINCFSV